MCHPTPRRRRRSSWIRHKVPPLSYDLVLISHSITHHKDHAPVFQQRCTPSQLTWERQPYQLQLHILSLIARAMKPLPPLHPQFCWYLFRNQVTFYWKDGKKHLLMPDKPLTVDERSNFTQVQFSKPGSETTGRRMSDLKFPHRQPYPILYRDTWNLNPWRVLNNL